MAARQSMWEGGKPNRHTAVTPKTLSKNAGVRSIQRIISLGTGAVSTATRIVGIMPKGGGKVIAIKFAGQAAVTGTSLTAEVKKISADGATSTTLQSAATDVLFTASTDDEANAASLTATTANLTVAEDLVLEVVLTANAVTAGPDDFVVTIDFVPSEDVKASNEITTVADLL